MQELFFGFVVIGLILVSVILFVALIYLFQQLKKSQGKVENIVKNYEVQLRDIQVKHQKEIEKARQQSVDTSRRTIKGQIAEQLAPILAGFPYLPSDSHFIGDPIDYIVFNGYTDLKDKHTMNDDFEVVILDIKHNKASLSEGQRAIAKAIEAGKVRFEVVRILEDGTIKTHSWNSASKNNNGSPQIQPVISSPKVDFVEETPEKNNTEGQRATMLKVLEKYPNAYNPWDTKDDNLLKEKHKAGLSLKELSELFQRRPSAIRSRLKKMGVLV